MAIFRALALGCAAFGGGAGCSLFVNFDNSQIPIDAMLDAPYTADQCAFQEPNDLLAAAMPFPPGTAGVAAICPTDASIQAGVDDVDYYKITLADGTSTVQIKIDFSDALGDLDLKLYDVATQTVQAQSTGFADEESLTCPGVAPSCPQLPAGDYVFEVFGAKPGVTNFYTPSVTITPATP